MEFYNEMRSNGFPGDPKLQNLFETFVSSSKNHWGRGKDYHPTLRETSTLVELETQDFMKDLAS